MESKKTNRNKAKENRNALYSVKVTLFHKVRGYSFNEEERRILERAVGFAESALQYDIALEEVTEESVTISIKNVPEAETETAEKEVSAKISSYMFVESESVKRGLRRGHSFMFKGKEETITEISKQ